MALSARDLAKVGGAGTTVLQLLSSFQLSNVPIFVNTCLCHWAAGLRPLILMTRVATPVELMKMQGEGRRCVTCFCAPDELGKRRNRRTCAQRSFQDEDVLVSLSRAGVGGFVSAVRGQGLAALRSPRPPARGEAGGARLLLRTGWLAPPHGGGAGLAGGRWLGAVRQAAAAGRRARDLVSCHDIAVVAGIWVAFFSR